MFPLPNHTSEAICPLKAQDVDRLWPHGVAQGKQHSPSSDSSYSPSHRKILHWQEQWIAMETSLETGVFQAAMEWLRNRHGPHSLQRHHSPCDLEVCNGLRLPSNFSKPELVRWQQKEALDNYFKPTQIWFTKGTFSIRACILMMSQFKVKEQDWEN